MKLLIPCGKLPDVSISVAAWTTLILKADGLDAVCDALERIDCEDIQVSLMQIILCG